MLIAEPYRVKKEAYCRNLDSQKNVAIRYNQFDWLRLIAHWVYVKKIRSFLNVNKTIVLYIFHWLSLKAIFLLWHPLSIVMQAIIQQLLSLSKLFFESLVCSLELPDSINCTCNACCLIYILYYTCKSMKCFTYRCNAFRIDKSSSACSLQLPHFEVARKSSVGILNIARVF
jgi:hypothetical protein